jgi:putative hydrolase of the HAD superfamily
LYDHGKISSEVIRQERFKQILSAFQVMDAALVETLSVEYLHHSPRKGGLVPHTTEVLTYLSKKYSLTVITNGFEDIQFLKLASGNLTGFFNHVVTSQKAGFKKPAREIFDYALSLNNIKPHQAIMIGDNLLTDIAGARNAGVDVIYFNPEGVPSEAEVTHEIRSLAELYALL